MKRIFFLIALLFTVSVSTQAQQGPFRFPAYTTPHDYQPGVIVYKLKASKINTMIYGHNARYTYQQPVVLKELKASTPTENFPHGLLPNTRANNQKLTKNEIASNGSQKLAGIYTVNIPLAIDIERAITQLRQAPNVIYAEPIYTNFQSLKTNKKTAPFLTPNDPEISNQYYLNKVKAKQAWDVQTGDPNMLIGVVDFGFDVHFTGTLQGHRDLIGNVSQPIDVGVNPNDNDLRYAGTQSTHGTEVAGVCSAVPNNATDIVGIGYNCKCITIKASDDAGNFTNGLRGIQTAAVNGAKVINMSWGRPGAPSQFENDLLRALVEIYDVVLIASAGQDVTAPFDGGTEQYWYPASYSDVVLSVAGSNENNEKPAAFDFNEKVGITAPGVNIRTLTNGDAVTGATGTSFSAPIVAGAAALLRVQYPSLKASQIIARLRATANKNAIYGVVANNAYAEKLGSGLLDIHQALTETSPKFLSLEAHTTNSNAQAGSNTNIVCSFKNQLTAIGNLQVELSTTSSAVTISQNTANLGAVATLEVVDNAISPFSVTVSSGIAANTRVLFTLTFKDDGTTLHTLSFYETLNPTNAGNKQINLSINDLKLTMNDVGRLGVYNTPSAGRSLGLGLNYKGKTILDEAGFMIGTSSSKVSNSVLNGESSTSVTRDQKFTTQQSSLRYSMINDTIQDITIKYEDVSNNPDRIQVEITQRSRAWKKTNKNKFIILEYTIRNISGITINDAYAGIFADWGIGNYQSNSVFWDASSGFGIVHDGSTYAGIKLLSSQSKTHYAIENSGVSGGVSTNVDFTTAEKFTALSNTDFTQHQSVANTDVSHVTGAHLTNLKHNEAQQVTFAIVAGDNLADLRAVANQAQQQYQLIKTSPVPAIADQSICRGSSVSLAPSNGTNFEFYAAPPPAALLHKGRSFTLNNVSNKDTIYIVNKDSLWPSATKQVIINVEGPKAQFAMPNDTSNTTSLVAFSDNSVGASQWVWDFGNGQAFNGQTPPAQTFVTPGTYQVKLKVTSTAGCIDSVMQSLFIADCSSWTDNIVTRTDTLDIGKEDTLSFKNTATGAVSYQWHFGNGNTSTKAAPLQLFPSTGRFDITLTTVNAQGCIAMSSKTLVVINSFVVGVDEKIKQQIKLYPNPTRENIQLDLPALSGPAQVHINNLRGQTIYTYHSKHSQAQTLRLDKLRLPTGIYIVRVQWGDNFWISRLLVQNK